MVQGAGAAGCAFQQHRPRPDTALTAAPGSSLTHTGRPICALRSRLTAPSDINAILRPALCVLGVRVAEQQAGPEHLQRASDYYFIYLTLSVFVSLVMVHPSSESEGVTRVEPLVSGTSPRETIPAYR